MLREKITRIGGHHESLCRNMSHLETAVDCSGHVRQHLLERTGAVRAEDSKVYHTPFLKPAVIADEQQRAFQFAKRPFLLRKSEVLLLGRFQLQLFLKVEAALSGE